MSEPTKPVHPFDGAFTAADDESVWGHVKAPADELRGAAAVPLTDEEIEQRMAEKRRQAEAFGD